MKVLIVCSGNRGKIAPFIEEQVRALEETNVKVQYFLIKGKSIIGYLKNIIKLKQFLKNNCFDLVHAHYGLSGVVAGFQRSIPVITTYHGTDINRKSNRIFSFIASRLSKHNIYVSKQLYELLPSKNYTIIPAGVDLNNFYCIERLEARKLLGLSLEKKYILFSASFSNPIKNSSLAISAINNINDPNIELLELDGYSRKKVNLLLNAVNIALLTSHSEGSPQFIKEALAVNCPIVSTNVGDVEFLLEGTSGNYISKANVNDISSNIKQAIDYSLKYKKAENNNRINILELDQNSTVNKVLNVYKNVLYSS